MINSLKRKEIKLEENNDIDDHINYGLSNLRKFFNKNSQNNTFMYHNLYSGDDSIFVFPIIFCNKFGEGLVYNEIYICCISYLCIKFNNGTIIGNPHNITAEYSIINYNGLINPDKEGEEEWKNTDNDLEGIEGFKEDGDGNINGKVGCKKNLTYYFFINGDDTNPIIYNSTDYFYIISKFVDDYMYISSSLFTFDLNSEIVVFNENCPFLPINYKDYMVNEIEKINPFYGLVDNINFYKKYNGVEKDILLARWFSKSIPKDNPFTSFPCNLDDCYYCFCYPFYTILYNN